MREILFFLFLLVGGPNLPAQCNKINFTDTSMSYAYTKAKKEKKEIFLFIYELGEKKAGFFQSGIFYKKEICNLFNSKFVNIKAKKNSKLGQEMIRKYQITSFPCFLILTAQGKLKAQTDAINGTKDLKAFGLKN